ncbi:MAG TPA: protein translocase subunit SecF [Pseudomonadales bacterium]|nr:protein translocase subunit SecF [Pseudomonadales bacterium]
MKLPFIDFMKYRYWLAGLSGTMVFISLVSVALNQENWGLDFTGGTLVEVVYDHPSNPEQIRGELTKAGFVGQVVQYFGSDRDIIVRIPPQKSMSDQANAKLGDKVFDALQKATKDTVTMRRTEFVGPVVGAQLVNEGGLGMLTALAVVTIYVAFRFQLKFALGALIALFHDVSIILGVFSITRWDFDLTVLAAILAIIGYSLNDTIVVQDRIRENFRKMRRAEPVDLINTSLNQTLGRTTMTSFTTLLVVLALLFVGGDLIRGFALALTIGIVVGTYSSIYIAANIMLMLGVSKEDVALPIKEGADD